MKSFRELLINYARYDDKIKLVYRPDDTRWNKGVFYGEEGYDEYTPYNHRSILQEEIVFEYDSVDLATAERYVDKIRAELKKDGLPWAKWYSGGRSYHLHTLVQLPKEHNALLKRAVVKSYCARAGVPLPDMGLCNTHMIRAEYGLHEKTGKHKTFISASKDYSEWKGYLPFIFCTVFKLAIEDAYRKRIQKSTKNFRDHPAVKFLLDSDNLLRSNDGRKNGLFLLVHVLKDQYGKEELAQFLKNWYKAAGGSGMSEKQIEDLVNYHYPRQYALGRLLDDFAEDYIPQIQAQ